MADQKDEIVKMGLDMYRRGGVEALKDLLTSFKVATDGVEQLGKDGVLELIEYAIETTANT